MATSIVGKRVERTPTRSVFINRAELDLTRYSIVNAEQNVGLAQIDEFIVNEFSKRISLPREVINLDYMRDCSHFILLAKNLNLPLNSAELNRPAGAPSPENSVRENMRSILSSQYVVDSIKKLPNNVYDCINADFIMAGHPASIRQTSLVLLGAHGSEALPYSVSIEVEQYRDGEVESCRTFALTPSLDENTKGMLLAKFQSQMHNLENFKRETKDRILALAKKYNIDYFETQSSNVDLYEMCKSPNVLIEIFGHAFNCFILGYNREENDYKNHEEKIKYYWRVLSTLCTKISPKESMDYNLSFLSDVKGAISGDETLVFKMIYFVLHIIESKNIVLH